MRAARYTVTDSAGRQRTCLIHDDQVQALRRHPAVASVQRISEPTDVDYDVPMVSTYTPSPTAFAAREPWLIRNREEALGQ